MIKAARYVAASAYAFVRSRTPVWSLLNRAGTTLYQQQPPDLDPMQMAVASGLMEDGISITHLDEILPGSDLLSRMRERMDLREEKTKSGARKTFLRFAWADLSQEKPTIDLDNPFMEFSLSREVLDIVNSYMATCSKLMSFDLAITNTMADGEAPIGSQRWHRDPGMNRLIKVFVYLNDVDESGGPFMYVRQSHLGGRWRKLFPQKQFGRHGFYPPDGAIAETVPENDIAVCIGVAGTIIFCDTTGLHKGGYSIAQPRIMFTSMYVAPGDLIKPLFNRPVDFDHRISTLDVVSRFAAS